MQKIPPTPDMNKLTHLLCIAFAAATLVFAYLVR